MRGHLGIGGACAALAVFLLTFSAVAGEAAKPAVIATLFPQYDFARQIAGDHADVRLLLPPGAESHSFEPTPADMRAIADADIFIYTGEHMEPWAKRLADSAASDAGGPTIVDASTGVALTRNEPVEDDHDQADDHDHDADEAHHHDHDHGHDHAHGHFHEFDPHIWLDPVYAAVMVDNVAAALIAADPANQASYSANAARLRGELEALHKNFQETVAKSPRRTLVFGERFAFAYFFSRYGLEMVGAYASCAPGAEPGLRAVIDVVDYVREHDVRYIYLEAMSTSRISTVIHDETGATILKVDSLHNLPADRQAAGATFPAIMAENMAAFAKGLE
ncbi:MAG: metal ABC transporter substrate-binding protein [Planctomycetaceae bacterium]|nr:metal ABC transporter substrate-binding protein [Planctomycetaceae bacterium]